VAADGCATGGSGQQRARRQLAGVARARRQRICRETKLPLHWGTNHNVRWRAALPEPGNSTPIVWDRRVFVTQGLIKENGRTVMCFDRRDGRLLWQAGTTFTEKDSGGSANPPCTPSPVTDGRRVIAWFGSAGVFCFDLKGRELWRRDLGKQSHGWGYASSPVLYRGLCLLNFGPGQRSFLVALDTHTGNIVWQRDLPSIPRTPGGRTTAATWAIGSGSVHLRWRK